MPDERVRDERSAGRGGLLDRVELARGAAFVVGLIFWIAAAIASAGESSASGAAPPAPATTHDVDLLIVGGNEAGCAAAVQAARLGVGRISLVNDIDWLGGQFSAEAVGAVDEWTVYRGKRVNFPRSGIFLEVIRRIREHNGRVHGNTNPGNAVCASETIEPAAAAKIFEELLAPYGDKGTKQITIHRGWRPIAVALDGNRVAGVTFEPATFDPAAGESKEPGGAKRLVVRAALTIDCSDWGDVVRLSGAKSSVGPDLKSRFHEPSAPDGPLGDNRNEMNPISYCLVVREGPELLKGEEPRPHTVPKPPTYHPRSFAALDRTVPFVDSAYPEGIYSIPNQSVYTHRRLVDRRHGGLMPNDMTRWRDVVLLNWPVQDYPLYDFPKHVADALEANEPGASRRNVADMTYQQRRIVFDDAKQHALGLLHHLQTAVHDRVGDYPESFRYMVLSDEFGTPDKLPPKPYVREGRRLEATYMLREQDIRAADRNPRWAKVMPHDSVFGFQFNIDFHPTRRKFLDDDPAGPWQFVHTENRNWRTDTDRSMLPLRCLVPIERDGLIGASKNIGVTSIVSSAVRLHGQMMLTGQAAGTLAFQCLTDDEPPRKVARCCVRDIQFLLARGVRGAPGVLLWPFHDLSPEDLHFEAVNNLMVRSILRPDSDSLDFQPWKPVSRRELAGALARLCRSFEDANPFLKTDEPRYADVPAESPDRALIESLIAWGDFGPQRDTFQPDQPADWGTLHRWLKAVSLPASEGLAKQPALLLTRAEMARHLWHALRHADKLEWHPETIDYLKPGHDADQDGIPDLDDPLPFDRNNNGVPDRLEP